MPRDDHAGGVTVAAVEDQLRKVADPCSLRAKRPLDVLSMGLINDLAVDGATVRMNLVLTDPTCLFGGEISDGIRTALLALPGVEEVEIGFDSQEIWTPDRLAPEVRDEFWPRRPPRAATAR